MHNKWIKRIVILVAGLVALHVIAIAAILGTGRSRFSHTYDVAAQPVEIPVDEAALARGEHLVTAVGHCGYCHGPQLAGDIVVNNPRAQGVIVAPNLTDGEGGLGRSYTKDD